MKIAHVTLYPPKGEKHVSSSGVASYSKNLVTSLTDKQLSQTVVCNVIKEQEIYQEDGVEVRRVFRRDASFLRSVHKELKIVDPDVIHIQQELALFGGIITAYLLQWLVFLWRKKTVITLHGVVDPRKVDATFVKENNSRLPVWLVRLAFRAIYTPLMKWSQNVIVHEQYFKDIVTKSYGINPDKVAVVPHGVEPLEALDQVSARKLLGIPMNAETVLFMGYATGYKGIDLLIDGFASYAQDHPDAYLVIGAGMHPKLHDDEAYLAEYARLQAKAKELIPERQYVWRGFIDEQDIAAYYSASDVSIYPYTAAISSSGPMSFAIGYEKPFLVSDVFGSIFREYPQLIFKRTPQDFAEKLAYFFSHRAVYDEISSGLKRQRNWASVSDRTAQIYNEYQDQEGAYEKQESITTG